jgi:hypothetical protein
MIDKKLERNCEVKHLQHITYFVLNTKYITYFVLNTKPRVLSFMCYSKSTLLSFLYLFKKRYM